MSEFEKLLEDISHEVACKVSEDDTFNEDSMFDVLKRRLLPLLEAGQVMADEHRHKPEWKQRAENWRLAKSEAFGLRKNRPA